MHTCTIRRAAPGDASVIHELIRALAAYEREPDAVRNTPENLRAQMEEERPPFECLLAEADGGVAGFALFFTTYGTWSGRRGLWLEDLFVREEMRGRGIGAALLRAVGRIAVERGCGRVEFAVLTWNKPALAFYRALGGRPLDEWITYRFDGDALAKLGQG